MKKAKKSVAPSASGISKATGSPVKKQATIKSGAADIAPVKEEEEEVVEAE